jgi:hypothetical protein
MRFGDARCCENFCNSKYRTVCTMAPMRRTLKAVILTVHLHKFYNVARVKLPIDKISVRTLLQ